MNPETAKQLVDSLADSLATAIESYGDAIKTDAKQLADSRARRIAELDGLNVRLRTEADKLRMEISRLTDVVKSEQAKVERLEGVLRTIRPGARTQELDLLLELEARAEGYIREDDGSYELLKEQLNKIRAWRAGQ